MDATTLNIVAIISILVSYALGGYWGYQLGKTDGIKSGYELGRYVGTSASRFFLNLVYEEIKKSIKESIKKEPKTYLFRMFEDNYYENGEFIMEQIVKFCQKHKIVWDFHKEALDKKDCLRFWKDDHKINVVVYCTNEQCSQQGIPDLENSIGIINILKKEFGVE